MEVGVTQEKQASLQDIQARESRLLHRPKRGLPNGKRYKELAKAVEARQQLESQQQENLGVQKV